MFVTKLLQEMGHGEAASYTRGVPMLCDNDAATGMARENQVTPANRHIRTMYHWTTEICHEKYMEVLRVSSEENLSDVMTKPLSRTYCERLVPPLTGYGELMPPAPEPKRTK